MPLRNEGSSAPPRRFGRRTLHGAAWIFGMLAVAGGCAEPPRFELNRVKWLTVERQLAARQLTLSAEHAADVALILQALFGTPDEPHFPLLFAAEDPARQLVSLDHLIRASGAVASDRSGKQVGLYREHCAQCHGISGDGMGPTSAFLNPYPRDFRLGKFKFKSTRLGQPPTDDDLRNLLLRGIPGTAMPSFRTLPAEEIDALVDYVIYLSMRGEVEHRLIDELAVLPAGERLIDLEHRPAGSTGPPSPEAAEAAEAYEEQLAVLVHDIWGDVLDRWTRRAPAPVPEVPAALTSESPERTALIARGRELFSGRANCALCHGYAGLGDGQTQNFDDWTQEWVKGAMIDPRDRRAVAPFVDAGAFPPRPIRPRNLRTRVYRGGDGLIDLYRRIAWGIEGTGMPDSSALGENAIWALVAYVLQMPYELPPPHAAAGDRGGSGTDP